MHFSDYSSEKIFFFWKNAYSNEAKKNAYSNETKKYKKMQFSDYSSEKIII
jgi:HJR/Mrr/RecB family endonuclease